MQNSLMEQVVEHFTEEQPPPASDLIAGYDLLLRACKGEFPPALPRVILERHRVPEAINKTIKGFVPEREDLFVVDAGSGGFFRDRSAGKGYNFGVTHSASQLEASGNCYSACVGDVLTLMRMVKNVASEMGNVVIDGVNLPRKLVTDATQATVDCLAEWGGQWFAVYELGTVETLPEHLRDSIYYVLKNDDLYSTPVEVVFGMCPADRALWADSDNRTGYETKNVPSDWIDLAAIKVAERRNEIAGRYNHHFQRSHHDYKQSDKFLAIQTEYDRLFGGKKGKGRQEYNLSLVQGQIINVYISSYLGLALDKQNHRSNIQHLHGRSVNYLLQNSRYWQVILKLAEDEILTVDPVMVTKVEALMRERDRIITPLFPLKKPQTLGWLTDESYVKCIKTDEENGFYLGKYYEVRAEQTRLESQETRTEQVERGPQAGEYVTNRYKIRRPVLYITVIGDKGRISFSDAEKDQASIRYLCDHFEWKNPGDVASAYPEETGYWREIVNRIEAKYVIPHSTNWAIKNDDPPARLRTFQKEDIARGLVKGSTIVGWDPGLGKTLGGLTFAHSVVEAGKAQDQILIIAPQDLFDQWSEQAERFFGRKPKLIRKPAEARQLAKQLKEGKTGLFITDYDKLTFTEKHERDEDFVVWTETKTEWNRDQGRYVDRVIEHTTQKCCPRCRATRSEGWNGTYCRPPRGAVKIPGAKDEMPKWGKWMTKKEIVYDEEGNRVRDENGDLVRREVKFLAPLIGQKGCGYNHVKIKTSSVAHELATAFRQGVVILDEVTQIQGRNSKRSEGIRGIRCRFAFAMTGTLIKNYIHQAFWPIWWTLGNNSKRFGYGYKDYSKFEGDFAVFEWKEQKNGNWGQGKATPEVSNLSVLWRMLSAGMVRRRDHETGEKLMPVKVHEVPVPMGKLQAKQYAAWLERFPLLFAQKYPKSPLVRSGAHIHMAPMLGLGWKLDYACVLPEGDPDKAFNGHEMSNYTPDAYQALVTVMALAKQGRKVLVGSNFKELGPWFCKMLTDKGVKAQHLVGPDGSTISPAKRAKVVKEFQRGDTQVLCAGTSALRLGHNIDKASACVFLGLPWDFETYFQFRKRIHRFTSRRPVDVYVITPKAEMRTIVKRKWDLLQMKQDSSSLALDGELHEEPEEEMTENKMMKELFAEGFRHSADEIPEESVFQKWKAVPQLAQFIIPEGLLGEQAKIEEEPKELDVLVEFEPGLYEAIWDRVISVTGQSPPAFPSTYEEPEPEYEPVPEVEAAPIDGLFDPDTLPIEDEPEPDADDLIEDLLGLAASFTNPTPTPAEPVQQSEEEPEEDSVEDLMRAAGWI